MTITDIAGNVVFTLTGRTGDTVSGVTGFLWSGESRLQMTTIGSTAPVWFTLRGIAITDPIGPQPGDSSAAPQYKDPGNPNGYKYPDGTATLSPLLFGLGRSSSGRLDVSGRREGITFGVRAAFVSPLLIPLGGGAAAEPQVQRR